MTEIDKYRKRKNQKDWAIDKRRKKEIQWDTERKAEKEQDKLRKIQKNSKRRIRSGKKTEINRIGKTVKEKDAQIYKQQKKAKESNNI